MSLEALMLRAVRSYTGQQPLLMRWKKMHRKARTRATDIFFCNAALDMELASITTAPSFSIPVAANFLSHLGSYPLPEIRFRKLRGVGYYTYPQNVISLDTTNDADAWLTLCHEAAHWILCHSCGRRRPVHDIDFLRVLRWVLDLWHILIDDLDR